MGIEEETDRTLFIRNLDARVTEELLFELFLQAGPLVKTTIPKDPEGKQKSFGFAVYKHEVSVPYAMQLLNGTPLYGRSLHVQFRSGSSHSNSAQKSPTESLDPRGQRSPVQFNSPPYTPPPLIQRSHPSPDSLQKHAAMNMRQHHMQQLPPLNSGFSPPQRLPAGGKSARAGSRQHQNTPTSTQHPSAAEVSATPTSPPPAAISSTAGTAITSIKTGPPVVTMTTEAGVVTTTTGATAETTKTIGGDGTETPTLIPVETKTPEICSGTLRKDFNLEPHQICI